MKFLLLHRRSLLLAHLLIALAMLPGVLRLGYDNSPENFFTGDSSALSVYRDYSNAFGGKKVIRAALSGEDLWTLAGLTWLDHLEQDCRDIPGVETVVGMVAFHRWFMLQWPPLDALEFRETVMRNRKDMLKGWVSSDGDTVTMLVVLADVDGQAERRILSALNRLTGAAPTGLRIRVRFSGLPVLHHAMDISLARQALRVLPFLLLLAVVFLALIFRRWGDVAVPLTYVGVLLVILFGIMGYSGTKMNLVTFVTIPLLFVISLATAIHILTHHRLTLVNGFTRRQGAPFFTAVRRTYKDKTRPIIWTGLTTLVAFGSLIAANNPPLRAIGMWSGLGIIIMTLLAFTFYPVLLTFTHAGSVPDSRFEQWARRLGWNLAHCAMRFRRLILTLLFLSFLAAIFGLLRLDVRDNIARYFPPSHPVRVELERLQASDIGVFSIELFIRNRTPGPGSDAEKQGFQDPQSQLKLAKLSEKLRRYDMVLGAIGSGDIVEASLRSLKIDGKISENTRWMTIGMLQSIAESRRLLHTMLTPDGSAARISILVPMLSYNQLEPLFQQLLKDAREFFPGEAIHLTGQYPLLLKAQGTLMRGLISALAITLGCIVIIFLVILRSPRLTLLVLIPNLWPVVSVLGAMGLLGVHLDNVSVMTASIVLGLSVDDTFHTLGHYLSYTGTGKKRRMNKSLIDKHRINKRQAVLKTMARITPAHVLTSMTLLAGFMVCAVNDLLPISRMGILSGVAIVVALVGDIIIMPALLAGHDGVKEGKRN